MELLDKKTMDINDKIINDQASVIRRQWKEQDTIYPYKCTTGEGLPNRFSDEESAMKYFRMHPGRCLVSHYMSDGTVRFIAYKWR